MSRAVIYSTLTGSSQLQALGFDNEHILTNYSESQRPNISINGDQPMFMEIRWQPEKREISYEGPRFIGTRNFDIWVHLAQEISSDFTRIDDVILILDVLLAGIINVDGEDGYTAAMVGLGDRSSDLMDPVYQTFCRSASYNLVSHLTLTGE